MRGNFLSHRVWDGYDAVIEACCGAWNNMRRPRADREEKRVIHGRDIRQEARGIV
jgi:hypothetical protein